MGRIVRDRYPIEKLPEDLRDGLSRGAIVRVTVEELSRTPPAEISGAGEVVTSGVEPRSGLTLEQLFARRKPNFASGDEVDTYVRAMRDEWD